MTDEAMESDETGADEDPPSDDGVGLAGAYSSLIRFAAGFVSAATESAKKAGSPLPTPAEQASVGETNDRAEPPASGSVAFGFAADLPSRIERVTTSVGDGTGIVRNTVSFGWRVIAASPIGWVISRPVDALVERLDAEAERLAAIGRTEYAQGRVLFDTVVDNAIDGVLDNVSESEALNDLIRDQALGISGAAIQEVRETGAAADGLTDSIVRRLTRKEQRPLPPKPANGSQ